MVHKGAKALLKSFQPTVLLRFQFDYQENGKTRIQMQIQSGFDPIVEFTTCNQQDQSLDLSSSSRYLRDFLSNKLKIDLGCVPAKGQLISE